MKQDVFPGCFANGLPASEGAALAATQRPLSTQALTDVSGVPAWKTIPSWAIIGTTDKVIPPASQLAMAQHGGAHITEIKAPHLAMIAKPADVTRVMSRPQTRPTRTHRSPYRHRERRSRLGPVSASPRSTSPFS